MKYLEQDLVRTITPICMEVLYRLISAGYDIITKYSSVDLLCRSGLDSAFCLMK